MSLWSQLVWVILPYVCFTIFAVGHVYRYATDRYGWGSRSSELLEKRILSWANPLFHYGVLCVIGGHMAGLVVPLSVYRALGVPDELYHLGAIALGGLAGSAMLVGLSGLIWRRFSIPRVRATTRPADWLVLWLLLALTTLGLSLSLGYNLLVEPYEYRATIAPYWRGLVTLHPDPARLAGVPALFQIHVALSFALFAVWPFTRLVHVWSAPLPYLLRPFIIYRSRCAPPADTGLSTTDLRLSASDLRLNTTRRRIGALLRRSPREG